MLLAACTHTSSGEIVEARKRSLMKGLKSIIKAKQ